MARALIRMQEVQRRMADAGRSTIYDLVKAGLFPPPVKFGPKAAGFCEDFVEEVVAARINGADHDEIRAIVARQKRGSSNKEAA